MTAPSELETIACYLVRYPNGDTRTFSEIYPTYADQNPKFEVTTVFWQAGRGDDR